MLRPAVAILSVVVHVSLLAALPAAEPDASAWPLPTEGEAAILAALEQPTGLDFAEQPLSDVVDFLSHKHKVGIQLDNRALTDAGVGTDTPITMKLDGIRLRSALRLMLRELDLTYLTRDGYLLITSQTEAENMLKIKAYAVRDLIASDSEFRPPVQPGQPAGEDYKSLMDLITSTVGPTTWDEVGGPGSIKEFRNSNTITVSQTEEAHEELVDLLTALRRVRDRQLAAAKALPEAAPAHQGGNARLETYTYRLLPWPRNMPWPCGAGTAGIGVGGGMVSGGMMGGGGTGTYYLADEGEHIEWDTRQSDAWTAELVDSLPRLVEPESWQPPGKGSVRLLAGAIVISQTREAHEKIAQFLAEFLPSRVVTSAPATARAVRLPAPGPRPDWPHAAEPRAAENEAAIDTALAKKCDVEFRETPFSAAMQSLAAKGPIKVWIDNRALTDAGIGSDTPVTRSIHNVTLRAAFKLLLTELDLTYVIRNEVFMVTSKTEAESMLVTMVYPVFDLVALPPDRTARHAGMPFRPIQPVSSTTHRPASSDFPSLIDNIISSIPPTTWDYVGGPGAIREFANSGALVISQTSEVHEEIAEYLRALREAAAAQR